MTEAVHIEHTEFTLAGAEGKKITADLHYGSSPDQGIAIFCHGFKGFKDWGAWNLVAEFFAKEGIALLKFNFSHNGVDPSDITDLSDKESFANNTLSKELMDLKAVIKWLHSNYADYNLDINNINLIGHSRGAVTCCVEALQNSEIKRVISWAGVIDVKSYLTKFNYADWEENGFVEVPNARTGDVYHIKWSFMLDFLNNVNQFNLMASIADMNAPLLMIHGDQDQAVSLSESKKVFNEVPHSILVEIEGGNHTFDTSHPQNDPLAEQMAEVCEETIEFIKMPSGELTI